MAIDRFDDNSHIKIAEMRTTDATMGQIGRFFMIAADEGATHCEFSKIHEWHGHTLIAFRKGSKEELLEEKAKVYERRAAELRKQARGE